jgi:broad specificity phosphatase PhoE
MRSVRTATDVRQVAGERTSEPLRLFVFARHAESAANAALLLSTEPGRPAALTERGRAQAREFGAQIAGLTIDIAFCSRLARTRETIDIALKSRAVPVLIDPGFDELRAGDLDGEPIQEYWDWMRRHSADDRLPHGESVDDALKRYAGALRRLQARTELITLVVTHELALRHIARAANPGSPASGDAALGNAVPYLFDNGALRRAADILAAPERHGRPVPDSAKSGDQHQSPAPS